MGVLINGAKCVTDSDDPCYLWAYLADCAQISQSAVHKERASLFFSFFFFF